MLARGTFSPFCSIESFERPNYGPYGPRAMCTDGIGKMLPRRLQLVSSAIIFKGVSNVLEEI